MALSVCQTWCIGADVVPANSLGPLYMRRCKTIREELEELKQRENKAQEDFTRSKDLLIKIRKRRIEIEKLLNPGSN
jgi:hypothetical protein